MLKIKISSWDTEAKIIDVFPQKISHVDLCKSLNIVALKKTKHDFLIIVMNTFSESMNRNIIWRHQENRIWIFTSFRLSERKNWVNLFLILSWGISVYLHFLKFISPERKNYSNKVAKKNYANKGAKKNNAKSTSNIWRVVYL